MFSNDIKEKRHWQSGIIFHIAYNIYKLCVIQKGIISFLFCVINYINVKLVHKDLETSPVSLTSRF